jgi:hypothetical protein
MAVARDVDNPREGVALFSGKNLVHDQAGEEEVATVISVELLLEIRAGDGLVETKGKSMSRLLPLTLQRQHNVRGTGLPSTRHC